MRQWENDLGEKEKRKLELETGQVRQQEILAEARRQLWRLREGLEKDDEELQAAVIRQVISKVEVHYRHERTPGHRSKNGQGRLLSKPERALLYVRPGLGVSLLFIPY